MQKKLLITLAVGAVLGFSGFQIVNSYSHNFRRRAERYYGIAYLRYRCVYGRWPRTTDEFFSSAKPEYVKSMRQEGNIYHITLRQEIAPNDKMMLKFSGSYLVVFEDSIELDFAGHDCNQGNDPLDYFRAAANVR